MVCKTTTAKAKGRIVAPMQNANRLKSKFWRRRHRQRPLYKYCFAYWIGLRVYLHYHTFCMQHLTLHALAMHHPPRSLIVTICFHTSETEWESTFLLIFTLAKASAKAVRSKERRTINWPAKRCGYQRPLSRRRRMFWIINKFVNRWKVECDQAIC